MGLPYCLWYNPPITPTQLAGLTTLHYFTDADIVSTRWELVIHGCFPTEDGDIIGLGDRDITNTLLTCGNIAVKILTIQVIQE